MEKGLWKLKNNPVLKKCEAIVLVLLFTASFFIFMVGMEKPYDIYKQIYSMSAIALFGTAMVIISRVDFTKILNWIVLVGGLGIGLFIIEKTVNRAESPTLWLLYVTYLTAMSVFGFLLVDAITGRKLKKIKLSYSAPILFIIVFALLYFIFNGFQVELLLYLIGAIGLSLISFRAERLKEFIFCSLSGLYLASLVLIILSLIKNPYTGDPYYKGYFFNSTIFGICTAVGFVPIVFFFMYLVFEKKLSILRVLGLLALSIPVLFVTYISEARNGFLGIGAMIILAIAFWCVRNGKIKKFLIITGVIIGLIVVFYVVGAIFFRGDYTQTEYMESPLDKYPHLKLIVYRTLRIFNTKSLFGIIPEGSLLNGIDGFTSYRLSMQILAIRSFKLFTGNTGYIIMPDESLTNAHNTALGSMFNYGIIPGGLFVLSWIWSYIYVFVKNVKLIKRKESNYHFRMGSLLLMTYTMAIFMNELIYVKYFFMVVFLLFIALNSFDEAALDKESNVS